MAAAAAAARRRSRPEIQPYKKQKTKQKAQSKMCQTPCLLVGTGSKLQAPNIHKRIVRVCAHTLLKSIE